MMRPGTYYVGDLCYVMHPQWKEVCDLMFACDGERVLDGEFNLSNGVRFAVQSTAYGDGTYYDEQGRQYPVDAGLIGCIRVEDVYDPEWWLEGVQTVKFENPFTVEYDLGTIKFVEYLTDGSKEVILGINTDPVYDEEELA